MSRRARGIVFSILLVGAAEIAARALLPAWRPPPVGGVEFFRYDPRLGWSLRPGWDDEYSLPTGTTHIHINSAGLRGAETSPLPSPGRRRILVLGDSFAFGFGVEQDQRFDAVLATKHPGLEFINAGVPGYGTDQELLYLETSGLAWRPELVLVLLHPNDVLNVSYARQYGYNKPRYTLNAGELHLTGEPVPPPHWGERLDTHLLRRSWLLHRAFTALAPAEPTQNVNAAPDLAWDVMEALLGRMKSELAAKDIPLLVVGIPWPDAMTSQVVTRLGESCARQGVRYLPLERAFRGHFEETLELTTEHWTPAGHRLAAAEIEGELAALGLLADPAPADSPTVH